MLGAAATANAATTQVNMYGASAQRDYWNTLGEDFMDSLGCTGYAKTTYSADFYAIKGTGCTVPGITDTVIITYGSVASLEGVKAALNVEPLDDKNNCARDNGPASRQVVKTDSTAVWGGATGITCGDIQLGTSDVEGTSFTQSSTGGINGYNTASFTPPVAPESVDGLVHSMPIMPCRKPVR